MTLDRKTNSWMTHRVTTEHNLKEWHYCHIKFSWVKHCKADFAVMILPRMRDSDKWYSEMTLIEVKMAGMWQTAEWQWSK